MWFAVLQAGSKPEVLTEFTGLHHYAALEYSQNVTALHFF